MTDVLTLEDVCKSYGDFRAVDRLSLHVPRGEVLGFLGPNGAGKTTTIRMVMGITYPDSGTLNILGASRAIDVKDRVGYLPEERGLYRKMTVEQTLLYLGRLKGVPTPLLRRRIRDLLERVGLSSWGRKTVESLSKGMSQKIQFAATLLNEPELVVLDEPFAGLDPLNRDLLETMLVELRRAGRTVIFSTHQLEQAERLCDRIVLINRGRKLIEGTIEEVRAAFPSRTLVFAGEGDLAALARCEGVVRSQLTAGAAWLELADGVDPNAILRRATELARLSRFEIQRPGLQEIFVRLVGDDGAVRPPAPPGGARIDARVREGVA